MILKQSYVIYLSRLYCLGIKALISFIMNERFFFINLFNLASSFNILEEMRDNLWQWIQNKKNSFKLK